MDAPPEGFPLVGIPLVELDEIAAYAADDCDDVIITDAPRDPQGPHGINQPGETDPDD